jgi:hypothetical protein
MESDLIDAINLCGIGCQEKKVIALKSFYYRKDDYAWDTKATRS